LNSNKDLHNTSRFIKLSSLNLWSSLITRLNHNSHKDQNVIESFLIEMQRNITDRLIYPDVRAKVFEQVRIFIKQEVPTLDIDYTA